MQHQQRVSCSCNCAFCWSLWLHVHLLKMGTTEQEKKAADGLRWLFLGPVGDPDSSAAAERCTLTRPASTRHKECIQMSTIRMRRCRFPAVFSSFLFLFSRNARLHHNHLLTLPSSLRVQPDGTDAGSLGAASELFRPSLTG